MLTDNNVISTFNISSRPKPKGHVIPSKRLNIPVLGEIINVKLT